MAYFADLSPYSYIHRKVEAANVLNVGWLDGQHEFPKGAVPETLLAKLFTICRKPMNLTRGRHLCELCATPASICMAERDGIQIGVGSGEIRVKGLGVEYASPAMIYHYVKDHGYLPPQEFMDALSKMEVT
jgi:hypothetical protein